MRWLDEHIRKQPPGEIQQGIQAARAYRHQLWQSAFRVGAVASFTELGDPDPRVLAERTLRTLLTDVWAAGGFDQVHALEHADTKAGWHMAYFAGWNAALDLLEEQAAAKDERPQLIQDTGRAEVLASQLLQAAASAGWIAQLEQRLGRSRLPDAARSVTRFARQATRAVQRAFRRESPRPQTASPESPVYESAYWPGAPPVELDPVDDEDLAAEARAMTPMSPRSADVIDISRRSTRSASMHPPPAAYPSKNSSKPARKPAKPRKKPAKPRKRQAQAAGGGSSEGPASA